MSTESANKVSEATYREIEAFLYHEARLADESRYEEWEALVTEDMHYWVPKGQADYDPAENLSYINDNRARLATRIRQLCTGLRRAQTPPSPMRRVLSNIEILEAISDLETFKVTANFVLYEHALQSTGNLRIWAGRTMYTLRREKGELRLAQKIVELVNALAPQPNLTFLI